MPFQVSPGVNVSEIDVSTVIPAVSTSIGGFAGRFQWGPVNLPVLISNHDALVSTFGKPNNNTAVDFYSAANFLDYSSAMHVVRAANTDGDRNASANLTHSGATPVLIKDDNNYFDVYHTLDDQFYAKYPGAMGNVLQVELCDNPVAFQNWTGNTLFGGAPGNSAYAAARGGANDELHFLVKDGSVLGDFSGTANAVLEAWSYLSKGADAKNSAGDSIYWKDIINQSSKYIRLGAKPHADYGKDVTGTEFGSAKDTPVSMKLGGGVSGQPTDGQINDAYDTLKDDERFDVSLLVTGGHSTTVKKHVVQDIAEYRKDCVGFVSPDKIDVVNVASDATRLTNVSEHAQEDLNLNSSYAFMDSGWKYQYDKHNDIFRWIPLNPDMAGLCARTDSDRQPWFSPAGYTRGQVKNLVRLSWNPDKANRDQLYMRSINPVVNFLGQGTVLFGDKTLLSRAGAFDRINVRRLFIVMEKAIATASKFALFEQNDEFTRTQFKSLVEPFLRDIKGKRGITDYQIVCDGTNNTAEAIDRGEFVGDIYVKPTRSINFIQLNFVAVSTGVNFSEIVGNF